MPSSREVLAAIEAAASTCTSVTRNDLEVMIPAALAAAEQVRKAEHDAFINVTAAAYRKRGVSDFGV
jgi:hypothetical protein